MTAGYFLRDSQMPRMVKTMVRIMEEDTSHLYPSRLHHGLPQHAFIRSNFSQPSWNNLGQNIKKDARKYDQFPKKSKSSVIFWAFSSIPIIIKLDGVFC